ncbi:MAG: FGGY family carbohydrate kinase [Candidatus Nitrotoga sp.]
MNTTHNTSTIALDLGTTSIKAGMLDQQGKLSDIVSYAAAPITGNNGRYESDALEYVKIAERALRDCLTQTRYANAVLGICSQRSSFLIWEKIGGQPVTPLVSWQDNRGASSCKALQESNNLIHALTGLRLTPYYFAPKLSTMLNNNLRARLKRGELLLGTLDTFLIWHWTQDRYYITDASMAARTLLMDIRRQQWSSELCLLFDIPLPILPQIKPSVALNLPLHITGIKNDLTLQANVADQSAALIATLSKDNSEALINLGTGGFVIRYLHGTATQNIASVKPGEYLTTLVYQDENQCAYTACEGTLNSIAVALAPYPVNECTLEKDVALKEIFCLAEPSGMGAPYFRADIGLTFSQSTEHLPDKQIATLLLEAIIFRVTRIVEDFHRYAPLKRVYLSGGLSEIKCLQQGIAQCLPCDVYRPDQKETSLYGAALLASGMTLSCDKYSEKITAHADMHHLLEKYQHWKCWLDDLLEFHH